MDVLHVIHQFPPETSGGSESYVHDLSQLQRAHGIDAQVLTGSIKPWPEVGFDEYEHHGIPVHRLHRNDSYFDHHIKVWHPGVAAKFDQLLERTRPKVIHLHHWVRLSSDLIATARARSIPVVVTLHDVYTSCPRAFRSRRDDPACSRLVGGASCWDCVPRYGHESREELAEGVDLFADSLRRELALAHTVLVAIPAIAVLLARYSGLPRERYQILKLGYRSRFCGAPKLTGPAIGDPFRFAFWGGVGKHKGVHVAIEALRRLLASGGKAELLVMGGFDHPDYERDLRVMAQGLPVHFSGHFVHEQLRAAHPHCGVFPSMCIETFGLVLDECFELGLPCIVSDIGAFPQRIGGAGLVTKANDPDSLAAAMRRILEEPGLHAELAAQIPPRSPDLLEHLQALSAIYAVARTTAPPEPCAPEVPILRRLQFLMTERDSALSRLMPETGLL
ncbi:MAG: glycosyltransferase [Planctomycetota bacterium]|nr:glycosyltransferase [Planctomycetota bacterium]